MNRLAVLGQPIAHSLSPVMHTAALAEVGLADEWSYEAIEVAPSDFDARVRALPSEGFRGVNVTIPHKAAALAVADTASDAAREIGAANALTFTRDGIAADNTDAPGLIAALRAIGADPEGAGVLVLGAGGAGRAAIWAMGAAGASVQIWNRTPGRAEEVAEELAAGLADPDDMALTSGFDVIINTTSVGLEQPGSDAASSDPDAGLKQLPIDADKLSDRQVVVDLVYGSTETRLIGKAKSRGAMTIDGLEILVRQGAAAFEIWTGREAPIKTMRRAVQSRST